jgi:hypothetical protein
MDGYSFITEAILSNWVSESELCKADPFSNDTPSKVNAVLRLPPLMQIKFTTFSMKLPVATFRS